MNKLPALEHAARMELYLRGLTDKEIGKRLFLAPQTVHRWRKSRGLPCNHKRTDTKLDYARMQYLLESGLLPSQVVRKMGCSPRMVYQFARMIKRDRAGG